ncbi:MAG TPA: hypothetical protein ENN75_02495 [candidate division Zixibacteria bacterium]|nr:hypothetical protein [candidate division Zixibacteria bacterium]
MRICLIAVFLAMLAGLLPAQEEAPAGPPKIHAELGLAGIPDTMTFCRSDSALLQYGWSVRIRFYSDTSKVPDVFSLTVKYEHGSGEGCFQSEFIKQCQWGLERLGRERSYYRIGNMNLALTDSSMIMEAEINPNLISWADSVDVYAVTDRVWEDEGFGLRDMTDYHSLGKKHYDRVGDINDPRFDIRFLIVEIENRPPKPETPEK